MKKFLLVLLLVLTVFMAMGCPFIVNSGHTKAHAKAMNYNVIQIHKFMDRHFWLYDWEDPYVN
ncbi:MAG: hypothetical protein HUU50_09760 [Candidatus Brocadiae bacterium]|nr:hypothetical protein [Candidatus Brocadiia bacterium]